MHLNRGFPLTIANEDHSQEVLVCRLVVSGRVRGCRTKSQKRREILDADAGILSTRTALDAFCR